MSYDPANDMAGLLRVFDEYVQATASSYRPDIDKAIDRAEELAVRALRAANYWHTRKSLCQSPNSPSSQSPGLSPSSSSTSS